MASIDRIFLYSMKILTDFERSGRAALSEEESKKMEISFFNLESIINENTPEKEDAIQVKILLEDALKQVQ